MIELPYDILVLLRKYICHANTPDRFIRPELSEWWNFGTSNNEEKDWRNFLYTSKALGELKRNTMVLVLSDEHATKFLENESFRIRVESLIKNRNKQLYFYIQSVNFVDKKYFYWDQRQGVSIINIKAAIDCTAFYNVFVLNLNDTAVRFICNVVNLLHLRVKDCSQLTTISQLPSLERLCILACRSIDTISNLPALQQLCIWNCRRLTILSIPPLEVLEIEKCPELILERDLIESTKVHLQIDFNTNEIDETWLINLNHLKSVYIFGADLSKFHSKDYFPHIHSFRAEESRHVMIGNLQQLHYLYLKNCNAPVIHFESLPALRILELEECEGFDQLQISGSGNITQHLPSLTKVEISSCSDLKKVIVDRKLLFLVITSKTAPEVVIGKPGLIQSLKINNSQLITHNGVTTMKV